MVLQHTHTTYLALFPSANSEDAQHFRSSPQNQGQYKWTLLHHSTAGRTKWNHCQKQEGRCIPARMGIPSHTTPRVHTSRSGIAAWFPSCNGDCINAYHSRTLLHFLTHHSIPTVVAYHALRGTVPAGNAPSASSSPSRHVCRLHHCRQTAPFTCPCGNSQLPNLLSHNNAPVSI